MRDGGAKHNRVARKYSALSSESVAVQSRNVMAVLYRAQQNKRGHVGRCLTIRRHVLQETAARGGDRKLTLVGDT